MNDNVSRFPAKVPVFHPVAVNAYHVAANAHYQCATAHDAYITVLRDFEVGNGNNDAFEQMIRKLAEEETAAVKASGEAFGPMLATWPGYLQALDYLRAQAIDDLQETEGSDRVRLHAFLVHIHRALAVTMVRESIILEPPPNRA